MDVRIDPEKLGQRQSVYKLLAGSAESGGANFGHSSELICLFGCYCTAMTASIPYTDSAKFLVYDKLTQTIICQNFVKTICTTYLKAC